MNNSTKSSIFLYPVWCAPVWPHSLFPLEPGDKATCRFFRLLTPPELENGRTTALELRFQLFGAGSELISAPAVPVVEFGGSQGEDPEGDDPEGEPPATGPADEAPAAEAQAESPRVDATPTATANAAPTPAASATQVVSGFRRPVPPVWCRSRQPLDSLPSAARCCCVAAAPSANPSRTASDVSGHSGPLVFIHPRQLLCEYTFVATVR